MSEPQPNEERTCPECGAALAPGASSCWLCRGTGQPDVQAPGPSSPFAERRAAFQFSLATLMLTVTLVAVILGAFRVAPGAGIVLVIIVTPAWLRTCLSVARRKARGRPMTPAEKLGGFAGSVGVVVIVGVAAGIAFYATCWAGFFGGAAVSSLWARGYDSIGWGLGTGVILGLVAGLVVGYLLIRRLWPRKE